MSLSAYLLYKAPDHKLCSVEVCDNAVFQRSDGLNTGVGALVHELGLMSYCEALAGLDVYRDDTGLVENDLSVLIDDGVCCAEVYSQFLAKKRKCHVECVFILTKITIFVAENYL